MLETTAVNVIFVPAHTVPDALEVIVTLGGGGKKMD